MKKISKLEANAPATLGAVVEAVTRLSTLGEAQILELVSAGKIKDLFPFRPSLTDTLPADTMDESELEEASALPPSRKRRAALIQASMPSGSNRAVKSVAPPVQHSAKKQDRNARRGRA